MALFESLGAEGDQMDYPTVYTSARNGWATTDLDAALGMASNDRETSYKNMGMNVLLDAILDHLPPPLVRNYEEADTGYQPFSMAGTTVGFDPYLGRTVTGRIFSGSVSVGDTV